MHGDTDAEIEAVPTDFAGMKEGQMMLRPTPLMVDQQIRKIPRFESISVKTLRQRLADESGVDVTCPITVGFHLRTIAEAANEALHNGAQIEDVTPFWRVMDSRTPSSARLSFDTAIIKKMREAEGLVY